MWWPVVFQAGWEMQMQPCNRIYYSKIYWKLNMFRVAYRSSSGALNCIFSLWFIYTCGDRPLSRLGGNCRCNLVIEFIIPKFIEDIPLIIRSSKLYFQPQELQTVFAASGLYTDMVTGRCPGWVGTVVSTQPGQRPVTTCVYKPEAANTVWSSWGCKYSLELLMMSGMPLETCWAFNKIWNNKFYYKVSSCWYFYWLILNVTRYSRYLGFV